MGFFDFLKKGKDDYQNLKLNYSMLQKEYQNLEAINQKLSEDYELIKKENQYYIENIQKLREELGRNSNSQNTQNFDATIVPNTPLPSQEDPRITNIGRESLRYDKFPGKIGYIPKKER